MIPGIGLKVDPYAIAKDIVGLVREKLNDDPELRAKIVELNEALLDLHVQNVELRGRVEELEKAQNIEDELEWDESKGVFWYEKDGSKHACCPACWKTDSKPVFMKTRNGGWLCPACRYSEIPAQPTVNGKWY